MGASLAMISRLEAPNQVSQCHSREPCVCASAMCTYVCMCEVRVYVREVCMCVCVSVMSSLDNLLIIECGGVNVESDTLPFCLREELS